MDRLQQRTAYVRIPLILFVGEDDTTASKQAAIEIIYEETSTTWLNVRLFLLYSTKLNKEKRFLTSSTFYRLILPFLLIAPDL